MSRVLQIDGRTVDDESECFVIAEIGHNHQGSVDTCKQMFDEAKLAGVDAVKLQKRDNVALFTSDFYDRPYNSENAYGATYGAHREALEFGRDEYEELKKYADGLGLLFFATAFDHPSADFLADLGVPAFKLASGDLTNTPLLEHVASFGLPMFVSTGGGTMDDVARAHDLIRARNDALCLLQCTAGYPPAFEELNLGVITTFRERFPETVIGLSAHDSGIAMALVGYTLGARVIEKHFTLNRAMKGTDHAFSLEPRGMRNLVRDISRARIAIGDGVKRTYPSEREPLIKMAKKLVAGRDLPSGHVLVPGDLVAKSPGDGIAPYHLDAVLGRRLVTALATEDELTMDALERD